MSKLTHPASANNSPQHLWEPWLTAGLNEDGWQLDWTTLGTLKAPEQQVSARIVAKSEGVWAAEGLVAALNLHPLAQFGQGEKSRIRARSKLKDGQFYKSGTVVCEWTGPARTILAFERPFLNLASYAGGIATRTYRFVEIVENVCPTRTPRVTSTRKTLPGYRDIALHAVQCGGGFSHRVSLSGGVLIKENHIAAAGSIARAIEGTRAIAPHGLKIEIEVRNEKELAQALKAQADIVMLDNFEPDEVRSALRLVDRAPRRPMIEVSGGLNLDTIAAYSIEGVDVLSVGSLTHSVTSVDLSLLLQSKA